MLIPSALMYMQEAAAMQEGYARLAALLSIEALVEAAEALAVAQQEVVRDHIESSNAEVRPRGMSMKGVSVWLSSSCRASHGPTSY